jgi:hypothetical protein
VSASGTLRHGVVEYRWRLQCALVITRRVVSLLGTIVVSVAGVARVFASIYILKMGLRKIVKAVTSRASSWANLGCCLAWGCWVVSRSRQGVGDGQLSLCSVALCW